MNSLIDFLAELVIKDKRAAQQLETAKKPAPVRRQRPAKSKPVAIPTS